MVEVKIYSTARKHSQTLRGRETKRERNARVKLRMKRSRRLVQILSI